MDIKWPLLSLFGYCNQFGEGRGIPHGHICKDLAVQGYPCLHQTRNKLAVGKPALPGGGVYTRDPKAAEIPLTLPAMGIGIAQGMKEGLIGSLKQLVARGPVPLSLSENLAMVMLPG